MSIPRQGKGKNGKPMHYSIGALIKRGDQYLLIDRVKFPFGFAGLAGHIDEGEDEVSALLREVSEESGLQVEKHELLLEEELNWNECSRGVGTHYWYLFSCEVSGEIKQNIKETKSIDWYTIDEIKKLTMEPAWQYWFEKLKII